MSALPHLLGAAEPPTAAFVASDYIALGVLCAAEAHGIQVPADLSIVGFDDIRFAQYVRPRLTTVRSPVDRLARLAAKTATQVLVRCDADPLLAVGSHGDGRSAVFASDCAPHWSPPAFMSWPGYNPLWGNLLRWLSGQQ